MSPVITGGRLIEGTYRGTQSAGAPAAGSSEVQTLTIGGTPTGGTFKLTMDGFTTTAIPWNATNATLIASLDAALEALPTVGTGNVVTAAGTLTAGIGTITLTFGVGLANRLLATITVADNSLTGTSPTLAIAKTTPGVDVTGRGAPTGATLTDTTNGIAYINTSTNPLVPVWVKVGTQT